MASGGRRGGVGERVLESRHVIGLFMLMLLFSGVFFTLGYVMGRNQYEGQVRAATNPRAAGNSAAASKNEPASKRAASAPPAEAPQDPATQTTSDWEFYDAGKANPTPDHLKPAPPAQRTVPVSAKSTAARNSKSGARSLNAPLVPGGSYTLQVAAFKNRADALDTATRLQRQKFPAFILPPQSDKYYRVQVGPYADAKSAEAAKKGLEGAGFKAIVKR